MRSAHDFDAYYATPDPWGASTAHRRDRALARIVAPYIGGKTLLELGCGEGHLTATVFKDARWVTGVDISTAAIGRAPRLSNAGFRIADFISDDVSFQSYDTIIAIECIYYLSRTEQDTFFAKVARWHKGIFIMSAPIIGGKYFTHEELKVALDHHGLRLKAWYNLNGYWNAGLGGTVARIVERLPGGHRILAYCPERFIYQRCYVVACG